MIFIDEIEKEVDYIVVGQGLAGTSVALRLMGAGKRVLIFDEPQKNNCSRVAAGLFNPITGKGSVKTWLAEQLYESFTHFYVQCERLWATKFFFPMPLYRPFGSIEEQNNWMGKSADKRPSQFVKSVFTKTTFGDQVNDPFGGMLLSGCGYLDVPLFLEIARNYFFSNNSYQESFFDYSSIDSSLAGVRYQDIKAKKIIFCSGVSANPFFDWLAIRPLKGETVTVQLPINPSVIFNKGVYLVPVNGTTAYKVGSTYELQDVKPQVTLKGRAELEDKLQNLLKINFEITDQQWGIRPTTIDRRPMLGAHPKYENLIIFNGLGTKGVSLAPYFSDQLANWLGGIGEILPEVNIKRFKALYSSS